MEYEYKAILFTSLSSDERNLLNDYFNRGWEYVHGFSQTVSTTGGNYRTEQGNVIIILKRIKTTI